MIFTQPRPLPSFSLPLSTTPLQYILPWPHRYPSLKCIVSRNLQLAFRLHFVPADFALSSTLFVLPLTSFKLETNDAQQSRRAPTSKLEYRAAIQEFEAKWFNRCLRLRNALLRDSPEEQDKMFDILESRSKRLRDWREEFLERFKEKQERYDKSTEELICRSFHLLVGSPPLRLSRGILIFQQGLALEERTKRMKSEGKYNVHGALGV